MGADASQLVETVLGPVPAARLGRTLIHEHLRIDLWVVATTSAVPSQRRSDASTEALRNEPLRDEPLRDELLRDLCEGVNGVSHDTCLRSQLRAFGGGAYDHLLTGIVPRLRAAGLDEAACEALFIDNPRRILAGATAGPDA